MKRSGNQPYILSTSSNLMGICFILITGFKLTKSNEGTMADEVSMAAAVMFLVSCIFSYMSMRGGKNEARHETIADYLFLGGLFTLSAAVLIFSTGMI
jgi:hypothetical protein